MITGWYWHVHHDKLVEWCTNYEGRRTYIIDEKPKSEQELRLRLFQPIRGRLPEKITSAEATYAEAEAARDKAWAARAEAWAACDKAWAAYAEAEAAYAEAEAARHKAWAACAETEAARHKAWTACDKAWAACAEELEALHAKECPDCPWDGHTISPSK